MLRRIGLVLMVGVSVAACRPRPAVYVPPPGVDVVHYDVTLDLRPETLYLNGRARLEVRHPDTLTQLPLALRGLEVDTVRVDERIVPVRLADGRLLVSLPGGQARSRVEVVYRGEPDEGVYAGEHEGQRIVYSDAWPDRVRGWLPGVHHPSDPATFELTLTVPRGHEAVATGVPVGVDTLGDGLRYRWRLGAPAPTYSYAFAVSDFAVTTTTLGDTLPVRYYLLAPDSAEAAELRRTPEVLAYFSRRLGPYPFAQYATVQVPFAWGGMENASASFLNADLFGTGRAEETQVHEIAHQWFGTHVVLADWRDLWLSEGMATYLTTLFYEHADGLDAARARWVEMARLSEDDLASLTELVPRGPVDPNTYFSWVPYRRGGCVLHLLRRRLGDDAFFAALRRAYQTYRGRPLSTEAFRVLLEQESGRDLTGVFDVWVYRWELPLLRTQWRPQRDRLTWQVEGDERTLLGLPVLLEVVQDGQAHLVPLSEGGVTLPGDTPPRVRPVGIMLRVE
ncbi:hypothetical protein AWN76_007115 [Rhodothermaceae bacterium RA]|nr:hypothetical protein AWN76_007115 [Rhodothermaceae bacterium RA]